VTVTSKNPGGVEKTYDLWLEPGHAGPAPDTTFLDPLVDEAWHSLRAKIRNIKFNAAIFGAELGKTTNMMISTAKQVGAAYRDMRKGKVKKALSRLVSGDLSKVPRKVGSRDAANRYLEGYFGWRLLAKDIQDAAEYAASKMFTEPMFRFRRVKKLKTFVVEQEVTAMNPFSGLPGYELIMKRKTTYSYTVRTGCTVGKATSSLDGLGFDSPLLVAWEIVPFSFLIDWCINISAFLESAGALAHVNVIDAWATITRVIETDVSFELRPHPLGTFGFSASVAHHNRLERGELHYVERNFSRSRVVNIPLPLPVTDPDPYRLGRVIAVLALIKQRSRG